MHIKKMIVPIIIVLILIIYYLFVGLVLYQTLSAETKIFAILFTVVFTCVLLYVLIQRINEIRSGEEDDLSKY